MIKVDTGKLQNLKYTESGIKRYEKTMLDYSGRLLDQSQRCAEVRRSSGDEVEITSEHVQQAVRIISSDFRIDAPPKWKIWSQVAEYILSGLIGFLGSKASSDDAPKYYLLFFIICLGLVVILFVIRSTNK
ncbi:hypothetical protein [Porphyromonas gulae]|uniref:Uncharacterized protein n=1 Tax=Porphyromonas gulae TaxID=111105 RepID=A0A0A2F784_9PORP|nr:hypothetical protein [Porphyromonas gulae]KGN85910.1 hypothetical protein HR15_08745 [Porphyromonas gulae]